MDVLRNINENLLCIALEDFEKLQILKLLWLRS